MKLKFDVSVQEYAQVREILARHLPHAVRVWVFGSRAKQRTGFNSDLDLALEGDGVLPARTVAEIRDAFTESRLPYRVDVLDLNAIGDAFRAHIQARAVPFPRRDPRHPALRFRDDNGQDFPDWEVKRLGEVAEIVGGGTPSTDVSAYWNGGVQWFTPSEINKKYLRRSQKTISPEGLKNSSAKILPEYTVLLSTRATVGDAAIALNECCTNQGFQNLISTKKVTGEFLYYVVLTLKKELVRRASGSTFQEIGKSEVSKIPIPLPSPPEQRKIAAFLSAVDRRIEALERRHALSIQYKRGLMQKLFSQDLRFRDARGQPFPDWETKRLGEVAALSKEKFYPRKSQDAPNLIELENIEAGSGIINGSTPIDGQSAVKNKFKEGDVLFSKLRPYLRKFAFPGFNGVCSSEIWVLQSNDLNKRFLFYLVQAEQFIRLANLSAGSKMPRAQWEVISYSEFEIPSLPEQRKIASFLSAVDRRVAVTARQVEGWKTWKRGLMQGLFPEGTATPATPETDKEEGHE